MNLNVGDIEIEETPSKKNTYVQTIMKCNNVYSHIIDDLGIIDQERNIIDHNIVRQHFLSMGRLSSKQAMKVLYDAMEILKKEPNVLNVSKPSFVLGDIHGQFFDLVNILEKIDLRKHCVVFLGDYVDRGFHSTEVYLYLLLLKTAFPHSVILLRGNHESKLMTSKFTYKNECISKYDEKMYNLCVESFMTLPIAAIIQEKVFCVHGGISKEASTIEEINRIDRFTEIRTQGPLCDMLWSDPNPDFTGEESFMPNPKRKCAFLYNYYDVVNFLKINNLKCIVRGHEVVIDGFLCYKTYFDTPSVITLFSAPNYCDSYKNKGAILYVENDNLDIKTFQNVSKPFLLPNNMDGINWSFPFIAEKIAELYIDLLKNVDFTNTSPEDLEIETRLVENEIIKAHNLVVAITLMRAERENLNEIDSETQQTISMNTIRNPLAKDYQFDEVKIYDEVNEEVPSAKPNDDGVSMRVSDSLKPSITREMENRTVEDVIDSSVIQVDANTDNATINIKDGKKEGSYFSCCFQ
ncbi:Serine/threonine-protein phosphatase 2B catalytic subunit [Nosema granulosis]|uniref:Serine/threonine-protein phosphatase n=1 Tax=Nosema granulosis TaxID=83296 RepID=A0A9P6GZT0_9MICR|nr:Serine/threonine-protein phosphatase 2B catalytic subunit [Nosema granulosis]